MELLVDSDLLCPTCNAPLSTRGYLTIYGHVYGYDGLLTHVISRQVQLPVIVIYAVGLARQIAI